MRGSKVIFGIIFAGIAIAVPWPIGGNLAFCRFWLLVAALGLIPAAIGYQIVNKAILKLPLIWVALIFGGGFVLFQSLPQSAFLGQEIVVTTPERFAESGLDSIEIGNVAAPSVDAISVYPAATREKLVDYLIAIGIFFAATVLITTQRSVEITFAGLTLSGVLITFFGLIQNLSWSGQLFWQYELLSGGLAFSSFVNKNNAAGFLLIAFGAAVFFVARQVISWNRNQQPSGLVIVSEDDWESRDFEGQGVVAKFLKFVSQIEPRHLYACAAMLVIVTGVMASLSRGGMLALACGLAFSVAMLVRKNRTLVMGLALLLVAGASVFVYFIEASRSVVGKLGSLANLSEAGAPRIAHWNDALPFALENNVIFGCGAGTYRYVTSSMQSFFFERSFAHAENVFLETLVEMGVIGTVILLVAIFFAFRSAIRLYRRRERFDQALGVAGVTTLTCLCVASFLDFGIYQPANFTVMAILMGAIVGCDFAGSENERLRTKPTGGVGTKLVIVTLLAVLVGSVWACYESYGIESRKFARRKLAIINKNQNPQSVLSSVRSFEEIKATLESAIAIRPDDSESHFQLGEYYVTRFRTEWAQEMGKAYEAELEQLRQANPGTEVEEFDQATIWQSTSLSSLHREFRFAERSNQPIDQILKSDERVQAYLPPALESYKEAERCCGRLYKTQFRLAQMVAAFDSETDERDCIVQTLSRNFWSSQVLYDCGLLALSSGDQATAVELWAKCLQNPYTHSFERPIVEFSMVELPMKQLFERVLPQNPKNLLRVARNYFRTPELKLPMKFLLVHTERTIKQADLTDSLRFYYQAEAERLGEKFDLAAENYSKALELEPHETLWRFEYAKCLHRIEEYDEAIRQLKKCELENSRIRPSIKVLLEQIRRDRN